MIPFGSKSVTLSMLIDLLTSRCRSTQVKLYTGLIASIDLWPQEMFTFPEMLALVESESSFGAFVCLRRPAGLQATSDLVSEEWHCCAIFKPKGQPLLMGAKEAVGGCSQYCQWQLCADKAHGGAVLLGPLARDAVSQIFEEVLYYPIMIYRSVETMNGVKSARLRMPTRLRMLRLLRPCKAIQNSSAWGVGIRLAVSVANTEIKQRLAVCGGQTPRTARSHTRPHCHAHLRLCWPQELRAQTWLREQVQCTCTCITVHTDLDTPAWVEAYPS